MTDSDSLRDAAVAALKAAGTLAGQRVYSPRDWPTWTGVHPAIVVRTPEDRGESFGRVGAPAFTTTIQLSITGRVEETSEAAADTNARLLRSQIINALLRNGQFIYTQQIQQFSAFASKVEVTAEGKSHLGDVSVSLAVEVVQIYAPTIDAAGDPIPGAALTEVDIHADLASPFDASGTYTGSEFPASVEPAPRASGPDGRDEGGAVITLPE